MNIGPEGAKRYLDVEGVSSYLGISKWMVYKYIKDRTIPFIPLGRLVRFDRFEIDRWVQRRMIRPMRSSGKSARHEGEENGSFQTQG